MWHRSCSFICISAVRIIFIFLYLEEFEPAQSFQIGCSYRLASNSRELSLTPLCSKGHQFLSTLVFVWPGITNCSLFPDKTIGNSVLWYLLKINVKLLYMYVNFATKIAAERSLSLLTMRNKAFMQQSGHTDTLTLVKYIVHDTQLSFLRWPYSVKWRQVCLYKS